MLDLDGTVYLSGTPIGDMLNTLARLRKIGKRLAKLIAEKKAEIKKMKKEG